MLAYTLIEFSRDSELFLEIFNEERLRDTSFMVRTRQVRCLEKFSPDDSLASDIKHFIKTMYLKEDHPYVTVRIRTVLFQLGLLTPKFLSTEKTLEGVSP